MTKKQAIREAKKLSKTKMNSLWFVVYDDTYDDLYGKDQAYAVCNLYDLMTFYALETPIYCTEED